MRRALFFSVGFVVGAALFVSLFILPIVRGATQVILPGSMCAPLATSLDGWYDCNARNGVR